MRTQEAQFAGQAPISQMGQLRPGDRGRDSLSRCLLREVDCCQAHLGEWSPSGSPLPLKPFPGPGLNHLRWETEPFSPEFLILSA